MDAEERFSCIGIDIGMAFAGKDEAHQKEGLCNNEEARGRMMSQRQTILVGN